MVLKTELYIATRNDRNLTNITKSPLFPKYVHGVFLPVRHVTNLYVVSPRERL